MSLNKPIFKRTANIPLTSHHIACQHIQHFTTVLCYIDVNQSKNNSKKVEKPAQ